MNRHLARRAARLIRLLLDGSGSACTECHCATCLRTTPHRCRATKLLDELEASARAPGGDQEAP